jgi:two-component system, OmpR family, response regulator ResD
MATILLVEDEKKLHQLIKLALESAGFEVLSAYDGTEALTLVKKESFDAAILDVMLPDVDGWRLLKTIKEREIPVIMATARSVEEDKLFGFELGADDYLTKPFSLKELIARVHVLLKNRLIKRPSEPLTIDLKARTCTVHGEKRALSVIEFDLLSVFIENPHQALSRDQLLNLVWGYDYFGDARTVDTHIKRLRQKLNPLDVIHTVRGIGYRFEVPYV